MHFCYGGEGLNIGLIDVDGHNYPNLALMRISAYHKAQGDLVEWWQPGLFQHYDIVYKSKVFSDDYSPDVPDPVNADRIIKGGSGYAIHMENGRERFDANAPCLPSEMERMFPDYSIYPQFDFAVAMTSRGCPRGCGFCHVARKEGKKSVKVADVSDFYAGQPHIDVLDPNITACGEKRDLLRQYRELCVPRKGPSVDFNQGLDIRMIDSFDIEDINHMRIKQIHFAWDNPKEDMEPHFREWAKGFRLKKKGMVYCLVNFNSSIEEDLYRIYTLRDMGYDPYVMIYDKTNAPVYAKRLQNWCNNKFIFKSTKRFEDVNWAGETTTRVLR